MKTTKTNDENHQKQLETARHCSPGAPAGVAADEEAEQVSSRGMDSAGGLVIWAFCFHQDPQRSMLFGGFYVPKNLHKAYLWRSWYVSNFFVFFLKALDLWIWFMGFSLFGGWFFFSLALAFFFPKGLKNPWSLSQLTALVCFGAALHPDQMVYWVPHLVGLPRVPRMLRGIVLAQRPDFLGWDLLMELTVCNLAGEVLCVVEGQGLAGVNELKDAGSWGFGIFFFFFFCVVLGYWGCLGLFWMVWGWLGWFGVGLSFGLAFGVQGVGLGMPRVVSFSIAVFKELIQEGRFWIPSVERA